MGRTPYPEGSITEKTIKGKVWLYIKSGGNWIPYRKKNGIKEQTGKLRDPSKPPLPVPLTKEQRAERKRLRDIAEELKKVQRQRDREQAKKEKQVQDREQRERKDRQMKKMRKAPALPNKVVDESQMKSVTICRGTVIRVQKDIPDADAIEKWYRVREERGYKWTAVKPKK